jgi:N-acyl-D-aspartate/D-glutamate deacylase
MAYDLIIRNGLVVDGTLLARRRVDLAIADGRIQKIGNLEGASAKQEIDAQGLIVAPGVIDVHTHYDAQIHWDPYCTAAGWHGTTSVVMGNCGFGYAPCRPEDRDRYMQMMVHTEQVPYEAQKSALPWTWETFPEWMDHLRSIPKGLNLACFLPMNALLLYVVGEEVKRRPATAAERQRMREILHEAMDAGAAGFAFSLLGNGNGHVDFDHSPVPTDLMDPEEAYNLARVLRERGEGVIQSNVELRQEYRLEISETLARLSGRPVIHNQIALLNLPENPSPEELALASRWERTLNWAERLEAEGLNIFLQGLTFRQWSELKINETTIFNAIPVFEEFVKCPTPADRLALIRDPEWRRRARESYKPQYFMSVGGGFQTYTLGSTDQDPVFAQYEGMQLGEIAELRKESVVDTLFNILESTGLEASFKTGGSNSHDAERTGRLMRHPRVLAGISDGGAHVKHFSGAFYSTDMLMWLVRDGKTLTIEEMHNILSLRPAQVMGFRDRGALVEGYAADIMIYDLDQLAYNPSYAVVNDLPNGDWRRVMPARGIRFVIVNGQIVAMDSDTTDAIPGQVLSPSPNTDFRKTQPGAASARDPAMALSAP